MAVPYSSQPVPAPIAELGIKSFDLQGHLSFKDTASTGVMRGFGMDFTADLGAAVQSISGKVVQRKNPCCSPIQAGVGSAARQFLKQDARDRQQPNRRRAIVVITDDQGTSVPPSALHDLEEADANVLGVIVSRGRRILHFRSMGIRDFTVKTGGDMLTTRDAAEGVREMLNRLRLLYSLYYALPPCRPGERRTIQVELTAEAAAGHPGAIVRARTGYFAPL